jgi:YegS/Rv2252/BmrU family lipid kinase
VAELGRTYVVVNPSSANGLVGRRWTGIRETLAERIGSFDVGITQGTGDATRIVREALAKGYDTVVSLGGDGTHNEVVNGFFGGSGPVRPEARLGLLARGTGSDLSKTLKIPKNVEGAIRVLQTGTVRRVDVGRTRLTDHQGREVARHFINIGSFGISGAVDDKVNRTTKRCGGFASFFWGSLTTWLRYRNQEVAIRCGEGQTWSGRIVNIAVANGQYFGGGMHIAPHARMDDGLFDVIILGDLGRAEALRVGRGIYRGTHLGCPKVEHFRTRYLEACSSERVLLDLDGEQPGRLPARFEVVSGILPLIVPTESC